MREPPCTTLRLRRAPPAAQAARAAVERHAKHLSPERRQDAILLTSELVTNAIRHTATPLVTVAIQRDQDTVAIAVGDDLDRQPAATTTSDEAEEGRGLILVAALATRWGVRRNGNGAGKVVWFTIG